MRGLTVAAALSVPCRAPACPNCKEAVANSGDDGDDPLRESRAYNNSVYFFVSMPYLLVGAVGFLVYRGIKKARPHNTTPAPSPPADGGTDHVRATGPTPLPDGGAGRAG
jgi:hypothetical protein